MLKKNNIHYTCEVCDKQLFIRENDSKNYKYVAVKKKPYYLCNKCTVKQLKEVIK